MNLGQLIARYRLDATDNVVPYFTGDEELADLFNEAEQEAVIRARLLHESANATVCQIAVTAGAAVYPLHDALYEIDYLAFLPAGQTQRTPVAIRTREEMDRRFPGWRERTGPVEHAIQSDKTLRLAFTPEAAGTLYLEGYRLPMNPMAADADEPEIHRAHHIHLVQWVLYKVFSKPDSETIDPTRAARAEAEFTRTFGLRPDADLRRATQGDAPQTNKVHWI